MSSALAGPRVVAPLTRASLRYWGSVAPAVRSHLKRWRQCALSIGDPRLRDAALEKLAEERFNVEVAATIATLAPLGQREAAVEATVALQVAYDYLDLLTETPVLAGRDGGARLLGGLSSAMGGAGSSTGCDDGGYLHALLHTVQVAVAGLPSAARVLEVARSSAERCARAQMLHHGADSEAGELALTVWAKAQAGPDQLGWREHAAGASASVLCLHALIAAAAQRHTLAGDAIALDRLYLRIGALTMLDSLVDRDADAAVGARVWPARYRDQTEMAGGLAHAASQAKACALHSPDGAHHLLTLGGVVAYYASARPSGLRRRDPLRRALRAELGATLGASMLVMRLWRAAKAIRRVGEQLGRRLISGALDVYRRLAGTRGFAEPPSVFRGQARR